MLNTHAPIGDREGPTVRPMKNGDCHKYLAVAQQYLAQGDTYRHKFLAAFLTNI
jgi:hypothetical protein